MKMSAFASALAVVAALACASPLLAQTPPVVTTDLAQVQGGDFVLDKNHAKIIFSISHLGFSTYYGLFTDFDVHLKFDPKNPANSTLDVTVQIPSVATFNEKLDAHLKSPAFFNAAQFPTATFKSTKIEVTGPTTGRVTGDFTLLGVTKPLTLNVTFNGGGVHPMNENYVLGLNATATMKRSDFGMKAYREWLGDDVGLIISGEFDQAL